MRDDKCFEYSEYHGVINHAISLICSQERQLTKLKNKSWNDVMHAALTGILASDHDNGFDYNFDSLTAFRYADECARLRAERAEKSAAAEKPKETICPVCGNRGMIFNPMSLGAPKSLCPACFPERAEKEKKPITDLSDTISINDGWDEEKSE